MSGDRRQLVAEVGAALSALLAAAHAVTGETAAAFAAGPPPIQTATFHVARWLGSFGPGRATEVALGLGMDKAAVSRLLSELVDTGLVGRRVHAEDARSFTVALTRTGRRRLDRALAQKGAALHGRLDRFKDDELRQLAALLGRLSVD